MKNYQSAEKRNEILIPKQLIDPHRILTELNKAAKASKHKVFRIFNIRTGKDVFVLHKGINKFLFRDPKYIEPINVIVATRLLYRMNDLIKNSNYLDFEIISEM